MDSAGAEKRPGAQEGAAVGQSQLTEMPGGHAQNSEVTTGLSNLQTLGHSALIDQNCRARFHRLGGAWAGALHPEYLESNGWSLYPLPGHGDQLPVCHR